MQLLTNSMTNTKRNMPNSNIIGKKKSETAVGDFVVVKTEKGINQV